MLCLQYLMAQGLVERRGPIMRIAVVTNHSAIVRAPRKHNGFGGIGRGYCLNQLYTYTTDLYFTERVQVVLFYIAGQVNPADELPRSVMNDCGTMGVMRYAADDLAVPFLRSTRLHCASRARLAAGDSRNTEDSWG